MYWLGIDVGTGGSRALLIDESGAVKHAHTVPHREMTMERPLWAEQDPDDWWAASAQAVQGVLRDAQVDGAQIAGVGLSGHHRPQRDHHVAVRRRQLGDISIEHRREPGLV